MTTIFYLFLVMISGPVGLNFGWLLLTLLFDGMAAYLSNATLAELRAGYEARLSMARREIESLRTTTRPQA